MATYDSSYKLNITPNQPGIRGISDNYDNSGQVNQGGYGLGDIYQLDYDRNKIEQIFNQGTDAQYALMQKENQIAQNQYANNQFANQQSALETLRQQRNSQIASGMARGLNAAQEQGTVLGLQQDASAGALELANQQQLEADKIAVEYANNVAKALQESNSVKQAMAQVAAQMYEADMLGYTGELSYAGQMDANASDRYGYELGLEGTKYTADKSYDSTVYKADRDLEGTKYAADQARAAQENAAKTAAAATRYAADVNAASNAAAQAGVDYNSLKEKYTKNGVTDWTALYADLSANTNAETATEIVARDPVYNFLNNGATWAKALDGNNAALKDLGVNINGKYHNLMNNKVAQDAINHFQEQIRTGQYKYTSNQQLMNDIANYAKDKQTWWQYITAW